MWQALLAGAVAGSSLLVAKHLLGHERPKEKDQNTPQASIGSAFGSPVFPDEVNESGYGSNLDRLSPQEIFRFSSSGSSSSKKKIRILRKKTAIKGRRLKFGAQSDKSDKRSGGSEGIARRVAVCLKKRKTVRSLPANRGSFSSKDSSLFGWGLGIGIMCMMSAGKTEISKLSSTVYETSKVVQELRVELYKRKSSQSAASSKGLRSKNNQLVFYGSGTDTSPKDIKLSGIPLIDDVECPSSVLTEEPEPQLLEMDQLEAELVSELQKLPWSNTEGSGHEGAVPNVGKDEVLSDGFHELEGQNNISYQCNGVLPSELHQKLSHLLIEQQENQIEELETELHSAQSKLYEKEAELRALKDCVRRLTEISLSTVSDDEADVRVEKQCNTSEWDKNSSMGSDSESRKSVVGMKRPINSA
ncbi:hypothetical protein JCGZ_16479 [Jatropha curcas]|uniref:Uncharacterized protein n=1 Tax=Jatropha curcas TaxID=180498 RepID=A0A067K9X1_JATCU|nr:hypothetical protein JCGZ_16479 [Jatropha curcas]